MKEEDSNGLKDFILYKESLVLSTLGWEIYLNLPLRLQIHPGSQFLRAIDSIGANIAEGFGRYHFKDSIKFYYYARGSNFETKFWLRLLYDRKLIEKEVMMVLAQRLEKQGVMINKLINATKNNTNSK